MFRRTRNRKIKKISKLAVITAVLLIVVMMSSLSAFATPIDSPTGMASTLSTTFNITTTESTPASGDTSTGNSGTSGAAAAIVRKLLAATEQDETKQFLVTVTRPDGKETVFKKNYVFSGITELTGIKIHIALYNEVKKVYEELSDVDGKFGWEIGLSGIFAREVLLREGTNKIKLIAYKKSAVYDLRPGENLQISYFEIKVLNETIKDMMINSILKITDLINSVFNFK